MKEGADYAEHSATPLRALQNLTTPISHLAFHPEAQILAAASEGKRNALKLWHLPSATAFANWPNQSTPLGRVTGLGFSPGGQWLGVGNKKGQVLLWSVRHYDT